jgi:predicted N-acetyltransferase YhbS
MQILIREAQESDYPAIGNLVKNELGYNDINFDTLFCRLKQMELNGNHTTFVAVNNDEVLGFIGLLKYITYEAEGYVRILAMAVLQGKQNNGIGSRLLLCAEQYASKNNITHIMLTSNQKRLETHAFYVHNGYAKESYGFFKNI